MFRATVPAALIGYQIFGQVINRVGKIVNRGRISRGGPNTPTQFYCENPPGNHEFQDERSSQRLLRNSNIISTPCEVIIQRNGPQMKYL